MKRITTTVFWPWAYSAEQANKGLEKEVSTDEKAESQTSSGLSSGYVAWLREEAEEAEEGAATIMKRLECPAPSEDE